MVAPLSTEQVVDAVLRVQICEKKSLDIDFFPDQVRLRLPSKRVLAPACSVPLSKMTDILSEMEENQLIGTEQRGGMWFTPRGNRIIADYLAHKYRKDAQALLGPEVLGILLRRLLDPACH